MSRMRLVLPIMLSMFVGFNPYWLKLIYGFNGDKLSISKDLSSYRIPCTEVPNEIQLDCNKAYRIPHQVLKAESDILAFGVGVLQGASAWYCETDSQVTKVYETGNRSNKTSLRAGLFQYEIGNVPASICTKNLIIISSIDRQNPTGAVGWKSGAFVSGSSVAVSAFKAANDFFASYFRAFLGVITLLFLLIFEAIFTKNTLGTYWYRRAMIFFSIHFIASSSILEFLFPNSLGLGFPLLSAGGTGGAFLLILSTAEIFKRKELLTKKRLLKVKYFLPVFFLTLLAFYYFMGGFLYTNIQWTLAISLLAVSILSKSPAMICFSVLFNSDVMAFKGILPGFPSNTATHFLFFSFIYDSFEWVISNSSLMNRLNKSLSVRDVDILVADFSKRFDIRRASVSVFSEDHAFRTFKINQNKESTLEFETEKVTQIAASVMTARAPAIRVKLGTNESRKLIGLTNKEDSDKGSEFCVFPLVHSHKVLGVLNLTGYSQYVLGDSNQMDLFLSFVDRLLPKLAETYYRRDLSPLIEEQKQILEVEAKFSANKIKNKHQLLESFDALARIINCKVITSEAFPAQDKLLTYSSHYYSPEDAKVLETHSPALKEVLVTSPSNLAYSRREVVYISDVKRMSSVYSAFVVSLFTRNQTQCLYVSPVILNVGEAPWGVIWLEFPNQLNRSDQDLRDLAELVDLSIQRQLIAHLDFEKDSKLKSELSSLIPEHVLSKIKQGISPREEETGYLLNIDLAGSTKLAGEIGDEQYRAFIKAVSFEFSKRLRVFGFVEQMIIWDAFIFTKKSDLGTVTEDDVKSIHNIIRYSIEEAKKTIGRQSSLSFRAVLHYGDTTRDFKPGETKTWGIVGSALAESCKFESTLKGKVEIVWVSDECLMGSNTVKAA